jgi:transketolase
VLDRENLGAANGLLRGGYVLWESHSEPNLILIGTGSELQIALEAGKLLAQEGIPVRVISLPSWELFDQQSADYRESVLPAKVRARVAVEAARSLGWERYVGLDGTVVGLDHFGASAPAEILYEKFGISVQQVVLKAKSLLAA